MARAEDGDAPAGREPTSEDRIAPGPALVIFDCDGVLVDSERLAVRIEARLIGELGWPITEAEILERFVGRSDADMLREIERVVGRPIPEWTERYTGALRDAFETELEPVAGIAAALDALEAHADRALATCVASSGTHDKMRLTLGLTGLHHRFEGRIYSATQVAHGKPAPDLFLLAASEMGVEPGRCIVVEDSRSGVAAARAAGMRSLGFAGGLTPSSWLHGPGTIVFDDMTDLPDLVALPPSAWPT